MRKQRHHIHRIIRRRHWHKGHPTEAEICITETTAIRDAAAITLALVILAAVAMGIEHAFALNGDVCYGVVTSCGGHPLTMFFRKIIGALI